MATTDSTLNEIQTRRAFGGRLCGCFGFMNRHPVASVLTFAAMGLATGIGLSFWNPEDEAGMSQKKTALQWIGLVGDLFIRALTAVVLPMVFATVAISMVDMVNAGKASVIGWKTIGMYTLTTVIASIIGIISIAIFSRFFQTSEIANTPEPPVISLGCNSKGSLLTEGPDGSIFCTADYTTVESTQFVLHDISGSLVTTDGGIRDDVSLSDTIYEGVFMKLVTNNIILSFAEGNFAAVVFFGIVFGIALAVQIAEESAKHAAGVTTSEPVQVLLNVLRETEAILVKMIMWIIVITPFAVFSLIAGAVGAQNDLAKEFSNVAWLLLATIAGFITHFIVVDVGLLAFFSKSNPFGYLKHMISAQTTAFACASSAATMPVTMKCVKESNVVPDSVSHFVLPLGATINMDGSAIYTPCACVWLAVLNGITPNIGQYILLVILSTIGSAGTAPVPAAGLVLVITAYNTVFNSVGTPAGFEFIVATDWFLDRLVTMLNVTGDSVVARIVTATSDVSPSSVDQELSDATSMKENDSTCDDMGTNLKVEFFPGVEGNEEILANI